MFGGKVRAGKTVQWAQSNLRLGILHKSDLPSFDTKQTFVFVLSITNIFIGFGWHGLDQNKFEIVNSGDATHLIYPHPKTARHLRVFEHLIDAASELAVRSKCA